MAGQSTQAEQFSLWQSFLAEGALPAGAPQWHEAPLVVEAVRPGWSRCGGRDYLVLDANDYLGLASDPHVVAAAAQALRDFGAGARAARTLGGDTRVHRQLEEELADFRGTEAALLFGSGVGCNVGVIPALAGRGDVIFSDERNHSSVVDGCRLSRATVVIYRNRDAAHLAEALARAAPTAAKMLIVTASVFSTEGDVAPLEQIAQFAEQYGALLMVDDAHAIGVLGAGGSGSTAHFGLQGRVAVQMGTMGKALGSVGGFIAGERSLISYLASHARSFLYTTALPPATAAAALTALRILRAEPERVTRLWENARRLHTGLEALGYQIPSHTAPICQVALADAATAARASRLLLEHGVLVRAGGTARLRTIVSAGHTLADMDRVLAAFAAVGEQLGLSPRLPKAYQ
ncbi:MAG: aminotransferase class I/II-fold pyridoxal phosphate-dependent enzyme [Verrucomicrobia bacterium]|nr:aminotransferase class I/II-fold pyridoxal phosphate-dependent enzyme [Verrucomicrobiota bacterium]